MTIDSHTHVSVRCEADWDLDSAAAYHEVLLPAQRWPGPTSRCAGCRRRGGGRRLKTLGTSTGASWDGCKDVGLRIAWQRAGRPSVSCTPYFTWQSDGEEPRPATTC